jgi:hypothetical protein
MYEACQVLLHQLLFEGVQSATMGDRSYTAHDVDQIMRLSDRFYAIALARGEISESNPAVKKVSTSYARIAG